MEQQVESPARRIKERRCAVLVFYKAIFSLDLLPFDLHRQEQS